MQAPDAVPEGPDRQGRMQAARMKFKQVILGLV